jgi:tetratricopeptide (TPR) repeat protein
VDAQSPVIGFDEIPPPIVAFVAMPALPSPSMSFLRSHLVSLGHLLVVACIVTFAQEPLAQGRCESLRPEVPADYFQARGCGLLLSVEQFHLGPGKEHLNARFYEAAFADFRFILNQFPNHPTALLLMAQTCEQWKAPKCLTQEWFERAIAFKSDVPGTYVAQGIYLHRAKQYPQAIQSFKRALELDPDSMNAHYNLGLSYLETKQYALANEQAQRAYALGAQLPGLRNWLERVGQWKPDPQSVTPPETGTAHKNPAGEKPPTK